MLTYKEQGTQATLSNGSTAQLSSSSLSDFLNFCETIGIYPDGFSIMIHCISDCVIDGSEDSLSGHELKKRLLFLQMLETFLNSIKIINAVSIK